MHPRVLVTFLPILSVRVRRLIDHRHRTAEAKTIIPHVEVFQKKICGYAEKTAVQVRLKVMAKGGIGE